MVLENKVYIPMKLENNHKSITESLLTLKFLIELQKTCQAILDFKINPNKTTKKEAQNCLKILKKAQLGKDF